VTTRSLAQACGERSDVQGTKDTTNHQTGGGVPFGVRHRSPDRGYTVDRDMRRITVLPDDDAGIRAGCQPAFDERVADGLDSE
jgi:hypothetical protein